MTLYAQHHIVATCITKHKLRMSWMNTTKVNIKQQCTNWNIHMILQKQGRFYKSPIQFNNTNKKAIATSHRDTGWGHEEAIQEQWVKSWSICRWPGEACTYVKQARIRIMRQRTTHQNTTLHYRSK